MKNGWRLGLDLGSTAAKAVLLDPGTNIAGTLLDASGKPPSEAAEYLGRSLAEQCGLDPSTPLSIVATGYGRSLTGMAARKITEITCHARGVRHLHPDAACLLDIGGQDAKAIRLGRDGAVEDFAMNDRCAAGTGCFLEVAARRYGLTAAELSRFCGDDPGIGEGIEPFEISSTCVVFAESELVGLNAKGVPPVESLRAVHRAIAKRVTLLLKKVGAVGPLYFTGGVALNDTLGVAIGNEMGIPVVRARLPQYAGALGAALSA